MFQANLKDPSAKVYIIYGQDHARRRGNKDGITCRGEPEQWISNILFPDSGYT